MSNGATPVIGHGVNNLDNGLSLSEASMSDMFTNMANEMLGVEPEDEPAEESVEEETVEVEPTEEEENQEETEVEEDSDEEQTEETEEETDESEIFVVIVDGEEVEIKEDELLSGYQRQKDYTRKTQELATERSKVNSYVEQLEAERQKYVDKLAELVEQDVDGLKEYENIDWADLKANDTQKFLMLQYEMNEKRTALQTKLDAKTKAQEQAREEKEISNAEFYKTQNERAKEIVEGWQGAEHEALIEGLQGQAKAIGFTEAEEDLFKHAIVIKLLQKAQAFDDLKHTQEAVVEKKIKRKVPKVVKAGTPQQKPKPEAKRFNDSFNKLKKTGNIKDSVDAFAAFL